MSINGKTVKWKKESVTWFGPIPLIELFSSYWTNCIHEFESQPETFTYYIYHSLCLLGQTILPGMSRVTTNNVFFPTWPIIKSFKSKVQCLHSPSIALLENESILAELQRSRFSRFAILGVKWPLWYNTFLTGNAPEGRENPVTLGPAELWIYSKFLLLFSIQSPALPATLTDKYACTDTHMLSPIWKH